MIVSVRNINRVLLGLLIATATGCMEQKYSPNNTKPNIVVFIADDISVNDLGTYGNTYVRTPHLDELAAKGLQFNRAFLTTSSCSPSRASILTGRYPHNTGAPELHMPLPAQIPTIAGLLRNHGYYTGASGKWHLGPYARADFDKILDSAVGPGGEDRWLELLDSVPKAQPFFLWMASFDAHRPWDMQDIPPEVASGVPVPPYLLSDAPTRADLAHYYQEVHRFDKHLGQVVQSLKRKEMLKNTILIVLSDNGRPFPRDKTRMYDSGLQTPLIWYWEREESLAGFQSDALISVIDLAPTLLEVVGLSASEQFQGISFASLIHEPSSGHRKYVFGEHNWHDYAAHERSIRSDSFLLIENLLPEAPISSAADVHAGPSFQSLRQQYEDGILNPDLFYIHFSAPRPKLELFRVWSDPYQLSSVADDPTYDRVLKGMYSKLQEWKSLTRDSFTGPLTQDHYDFYTAEAISPERVYNDVVRGAIPGKTSGALTIKTSDSLLQD